MRFRRLNPARLATRNKLCFALVLLHAVAAIGLPAPRTVRGVPVCESHGCKCATTGHAADGCCCSSKPPAPSDRATTIHDTLAPAKPKALLGGSCCGSKATAKHGLLVAWEASKCRSPSVDGTVSHAPTVRPYEPLVSVRVALTVDAIACHSLPTAIAERPPVPPPKLV